MGIQLPTLIADRKTKEESWTQFNKVGLSGVGSGDETSTARINNTSNSLPVTPIAYRM